MPQIIKVELASNVTEADVALLQRYLADSFRFSEQEWRHLRSAIERLSRSTVTFSGNVYQFRRFYDTYINGTYARPFLREIQVAKNLKTDGAIAQAKVAQKIITWLQVNGLIPATVADADFLWVYCLYRWATFARGYLFEESVIRDLRTSVIDFEAHDATRGYERYTVFDLSILGFGKGDIKASFYFLDELAEPLADFYITRLYDTGRQQTRQVVFLQHAVWLQINGIPVRTTIAKATRTFPQPAEIEILGEPWVLVEYELWKDRIRDWQLKGKTNE